MFSPAAHTHRLFVTRLLNSLPTVAPPSEEAAAAVAAAEDNPLNGVSDAVKKQLLALQVLFPNEFVPALDLLDRRLVTRYRICDPQLNARANETQQDAGDVQMQGTGEATHSPDAPMRDAEARVTMQAGRHGAQETTYSNSIVYYVRSAQQRSSRFSTSYDTTTCYEVRLQAWNCSCPAFAFAAFPATNSEAPIPLYEATNEADPSDLREETDTACIFGGISLGDDMPPVCKHLLACVLAERCSGLFGAFVEDKDVGVEEAAGWAAGWGD